MIEIARLNKILSGFKLSAECVDFSSYKGAHFYDVKLLPGGKVNDLKKYATEFSLALRALGKASINPIPEEGIVRIGILKEKIQKTSLFELAKGCKRPDGNLMCLMGESLDGYPLWMDIAKNPHMLIAGSTGSGKSTVLHTIFANLLMYPDCKIELFDPKNIEFCNYSKFKNVNISYTLEECLSVLEKLNAIMENRYLLLRDNKISINDLSYIVLIIDEFADLKMSDNGNLFNKMLCKLAQKSRAAKIHIILATQRPNVGILDGSIKTNFPARLACKVSTGADSKVILDTVGAEDLMGAGDSIINIPEFNLKRFQCAYTDSTEICELFERNQ